MKAQKLVTAALLLFALASLAFLAVRGLRGSGPLPGPTPPPGTKPNVTVVYSLHGMKRCPECLHMEAYMREALAADFADEQRDGLLVLRVENFEAPGNECFQNDFLVYTSSVILIEFRDGRPVRWKDLGRAWDLARGERPAFLAYVRDEVREFLAGQTGRPIAPASVAEPPGAWSAAPEASGLGWALATALGLGLLTALSPCPLTTNIAAISFLSRRAGRPRRVLIAGLLYALGGVLAYVLLGILLVAGLLSSAPAANFLNRYLHALLGPLLITAGLVLLGWLPLSFGAWLAPEKLRALAEKGYLWSAGLLGFLFALTFCPTTAGYFFGSLLPLAVKHHSTFLLPALYGLAAGLPVTLFAILVAVATQAAGKWFNSLSRVEGWLRGACGLIFILLGIYYALLYVFGVGAAQA